MKTARMHTQTHATHTHTHAHTHTHTTHATNTQPTRTQNKHPPQTPTQTRTRNKTHKNSTQAQHHISTTQAHTAPHTHTPHCSSKYVLNDAQMSECNSLSPAECLPTVFHRPCSAFSIYVWCKGACMCVRVCVCCVCACVLVCDIWWSVTCPVCLRFFLSHTTHHSL